MPMTVFSVFVAASFGRQFPLLLMLFSGWRMVGGRWRRPFLLLYDRPQWWS